MGYATSTAQSSTDDFVRNVIQQYRTKLLDLTGRNPLIHFRHSERSRSHIRIIDEIPEKLFGKLDAGKQLFFEPLPDPELIPSDETTPMFQTLLRQGKAEDDDYRTDLEELGPNPSPRQKQKVERELRNRIRVKVGFAPFQPTWEPIKRARELGLNPDYELPVLNGQLARRYNDHKIQTLFFAEDLERKLSGLRDSARVLEKDAGYNALYLAFGFLEYYESGHSDEKRHAPLVFVPVALDRQLVDQRYLYFIQTRNEEIQVNVALAELLRQMAVTLPTWIEDEKDENPLGTYLKQAERAIGAKRDWKLRRFATLGLFTFSTLAMYNDLDPRRWPPEAPLEQRPVLRTLIAGAEVSNIGYADDYDIDTLQGPEPLLITDADSSQHSAIIDVLTSTSSQVIQGPPGTGKSQTITNMIAAALNEGFTILFVAEKMAALEVVKKRLDDGGLKSFCLELHSSKVSKTAVTNTLAARLEYRAPRLRPDQLRSNAEALIKARAELLYYVQHVNEDAGSTGLKVYDILLGSAVRDDLRRDLLSGIADARFGNPLKIDPHSYRQMLDAAGTLESQMHALASFGRLAEHPWRGFQNIEITELDETRLLSLISAWNSAIRAALDDISTIEHCVGLVFPSKQREIETLCRKLAIAPVPPQLFSAEAYRQCVSRENRELLSAALGQFARLTSSEKSLRASCEDVSAARNIGSNAIQSALDELKRVGVQNLGISSVLEIKEQSQRSADTVTHLIPFCTTLAGSVGLKEASISALRGCTAALELLTRLPRPVWTKRSPSVLDEANRRVLERGAAQGAALIRRRAALDSEFDLNLLPKADELRSHGLALRSANTLTSLFSSSCRRARQVFRGIVRDPSKKHRRTDIANGLLACGQYLADFDAFASNPVIRSICGEWFAGLETPFSELLELSNWATDVRRRLAVFGDVGASIQEFLFTATIPQMDRFAAMREQSAFSSLNAPLGDTTNTNDSTWLRLVEREHTRADKISGAANVLVAARFKLPCNETELSNVVRLLQECETAATSLARDTAVLNLLGGSLEALSQRQGALEAAVAFASTVASLDLPEAFIQLFFHQPQSIAPTRKQGEELLRKCSAITESAALVSTVAQLDAELWSGTESFELAPLQNLLERNKCALEHLPALRDYLSFLLAEDAAIDLGVGPVLSVYSNVGEDYRNLADLPPIFSPIVMRHSPS